MKIYKDYVLSKGGKELGITWYDIERYVLTPAKYKEFSDFMAGQTCGCVDDSCQSSVVYTCDLEAFLQNNPNFD